MFVKQMVCERRKKLRSGVKLSQVKLPSRGIVKVVVSDRLRVPPVRITVHALMIIVQRELKR